MRSLLVGRDHVGCLEHDPTKEAFISLTSKVISASALRQRHSIPGSYAPALSEKHNSFLRLLKNKGFKEETRTKVGLYAIGKSTTLESNKSLLLLPTEPIGMMNRLF